MTEAFILGAGFSKAISDRMPTLVDLSDELVSRLPAALTKLRDSFGRDLETWLSYLAEDQPWLTPVEAGHHRADFMDASRHIAAVLALRQKEAYGPSIPEWLERLASYWHETNCAVITLNYDTLVEKAYMQVIPPVGGGSRPDFHEIYPVPIQFAEFRTGMGGVRPREGGTFRLLKLHGSINWCYSGQSSFWGETIYDVGLNSMAFNADGQPVGAWGTEAAEPADQLERIAPDKVTLIVPPTSAKSTFFQNETVRRLWRNAYEELAAADTIYCLGYRLPETDQLVGFMLTTGLKARCTVVPVNTDPEAADRYRKLLPEGVCFDTSFAGITNPIPGLVDRLTSGSAEALPTTAPPAHQS